MIYDVLVIGDEREGLERAISAARAGRRIAIVESGEQTVSLDVMMHSAERTAASSVVTMRTLRTEVSRLVCHQASVDLARRERAGIETISGQVRFVSEMSVEVIAAGGSRIVSGVEIVVACGTTSQQPASFHCDGERVLVAESFLQRADIPRSSIVVGAGKTGMAMAVVLARLGCEVTVVDDHSNLFDVCHLLDGTSDEFQALPIAFRLGDTVIGTLTRSDRQAAARLASGRVLAAEMILVCVGRVGKTESLNLEAVGVGLDERGRIWCDKYGNSWTPQISAVGDVVGFRPNAVRTTEASIAEERGLQLVIQNHLLGAQ